MNTCQLISFHLHRGILDTSYDEFLEQLKEIDIKIYTNGDGKFRAESLCPMCQVNGKRTKISFTMDERGNWHIYSLTRHSNSMHFQMPETSLRKRRRIDAPLPAADLNRTDTEQAGNDVDLLETVDSIISYDPLYSSENEIIDLSGSIKVQRNLEFLEEERIHVDGNSFIYVTAQNQNIYIICL